MQLLYALQKLSDSPFHCSRDVTGELPDCLRGLIDSLRRLLVRGNLLCKRGCKVADRGAMNRIAAGDANIRAGRFQDGVPVGINLAGKTLGLIGLGRLGGHMARYGRALNMHLLAWSQNLTAERAEAGMENVEAKAKGA